MTRQERAQQVKSLRRVRQMTRQMTRQERAQQMKSLLKKERRKTIIRSNTEIILFTDYYGSFRQSS